MKNTANQKEKASTEYKLVDRSESCMRQAFILNHSEANLAGVKDDGRDYRCQSGDKGKLVPNDAIAANKICFALSAFTRNNGS